MALKLALKLQTPTIELKLSCKDASGSVDSFLVGFRRYEIQEVDQKLKNFEASVNSLGTDDKEFIEYIKSEVVYIKQAKLSLADAEKGTEKDLVIQDTRTVKPVETLWESPEECLAVLLDLYLASAPYRVSFITAVQKALINNDYSDTDIKNS